MSAIYECNTAINPGRALCNSSNGEIRSKRHEMKQLTSSLNSVWSGSDASAYIAKTGLFDEMQKIETELIWIGQRMSQSTGEIARMSQDSRQYAK